MDILDQLQREWFSLADSPLNAEAMGLNLAARQEIERLRARVAGLEAERAELVKDRERLDWLNTADNGAYHCDILWRAIDSGTFVPDPVRERPNIRQAIDAAREGE